MDITEVLLLVLKKIWPLIVIVGFIYIIIELYPAFFARWKRKKKFEKGKVWHTDRELLQWLRKMKPSEFEYYIANLFSSLGYKTEKVGKSHDGGIDVIAKKDGKNHYIQCKKFITSQVTLGDVRDFYGALADHLSDGKGYFITTNKFTLEASKFVEDKPIELIDGFELIRYIKMAKKDNNSDKPDEVTEKCTQCGGGLVKRTGKYGEFLGCSNYPKCKYTKKL